MVETITPVVHGGSRKRWAGVLVLHVAGAVLSSAALGAALGVVGSALGAPWGTVGAVAVAALALLYAAREAFGLPVPVLDARRQVPQWWREAFAPGTTAFLYGLGLGVGFLTHLGHGTLVAVAAAVVAGGDPVAGAAVFAAFGLARSTAVAVTWTAGDRGTATRLAASLERVGAGPVPRVLNGVALAGLAAAVAAAARAPSGDVGIVPALILATAFAWAALSKLIRPAVWRRTVHAHALAPPPAAGATVAVPVLEAAVPVLVVAGAVDVAAGLALGLLLAFSAALIRLRTRLGDRLPCGCFGSARTRDVRLLLARNAALAVLALAALSGPDRLAALRAPDGSELLPAGLALAGTAVAVALLRRAADLFRGSRPLLGR